MLWTCIDNADSSSPPSSSTKSSTGAIFSIIFLTSEMGVDIKIATALGGGERKDEFGGLSVHR